MMTGFCWEDCCACDLATDDFDRADTSDLGADWTEEAGAWAIATNKLESTSSNGLLIHALSITAADDPDVTVQATVNIASIDDVARLIVGWVDANNYYFVDAHAEAGTLFLRLGKVVSGSTTYLTNRVGTLEPITWGNAADFTLLLCVTDGQLKANAYQTESTAYAVFVEAAATMPTTYQCGIGSTTNSGTITFDNFLVSRCINCATRCAVLYDEFDNSSAGDNWETVSGSWTFGGAAATTSGTALLVSNTNIDEDPDDSPDIRGMVVEARVAVEPGGSAILATAYSSSTSFLFALYALSTDGKTVLLRLYQRTAFGTGYTLLQSVTVATYVTAATNVVNVLRLCYDGTSLSVVCRDSNGGALSPPALTHTITGMTGRRFGIGSYLSSGLATFPYIIGSRQGTDPDFSANPTGDIPTNVECPTCPPICGACNNAYPPPQQMTVTIPAGLTNQLCGACDQVAGDYVVRNTGGCVWRYRGPVLCTTTSPGCSPADAPTWIDIEVRIAAGFGGSLIYEAIITFDRVVSCIDPTSPWNLFYSLTVSSPPSDACQSFPRTLTRTAENLGSPGNYVCTSGTSPNTLTLSA